MTYRFQLEDSPGYTNLATDRQNAGMVAKGTVLLKAVSSVSDRQDYGSLIMMRSRPGAPLDRDELLSLTPYSTGSSPTDQPSDPFTSEINLSGFTQNLYYCGSGVNCKIDSPISESRPAKKITTSTVTGNFEEVMTINEGSLSESNIHWGWWQNPDHATTVGASDQVNDSEGLRNVFFMYEDFAQEANVNGEMYLPTTGITAYDVLDKTRLQINTESNGDQMTDDYWLDSATMSIDFGINTLKTSLKIAHIITDDSVHDHNQDTGSYGPGSGTSIDMDGTTQDVDFIYSKPVDVNGYTNFDRATGRFSVNQGFITSPPDSVPADTSGQTVFVSKKDDSLSIGAGSFSAIGAMMGVNGSHVGMGYKMAIKNVVPGGYEDTVSGMVLFQAQE
jgi:hypothetical protein